MSQISLSKWSAGWPYSTLEDGVTPIWQDTTPLAQGGSGNAALGEAVWNNLTDLFRQNFSREPLPSELDPWYASFWDETYYNSDIDWSAPVSFERVKQDFLAWAKLRNDYRPAGSGGGMLLPLLIIGAIWWKMKK